MRLAITCPYDLGVPGGVQAQAIGMSRFLATDHEVHLYAPGEASLDISENVNYLGLGPTVGIKANGSVAPISLRPSAVRHLLQRVGELQPEAIIMHEPLVPLFSPVLLARHPSPTVGVFHRSGGDGAYRAFGPIARMLARRIDRGVVVSESARKSIAALVGSPAANYSLIENAVDLSRFAPAATRHRIERTVFFLGRHEERKGLRTLLMASRLLQSPVTLWVGGSGPETESLKREFGADPGVEFLGRLSDEEVVNRLHDCALFVAPSLGGESFGVILIEAMAAGSPVLCSDIEGYRRAAGVAAEFVAPGSAILLAEHIDEILSDGARRERLMFAGLRHASAYDFSRLAFSYEQILTEIGSSS